MMRYHIHRQHQKAFLRSIQPIYGSRPNFARIYLVSSMYAENGQEQINLLSL